MKTSISSRENTSGSVQTAQISMGSQPVSLPHVEEDPIETMYASEEALSFKLYLKERLIRKTPPEDLWHKILHAMGNQGTSTGEGTDSEKNNTKFTLG
jgi:hypothetical protein